METSYPNLEIEKVLDEFWKEKGTEGCQNATSTSDMSKDGINQPGVGNTGNELPVKDVETVLNELFLIREEPVQNLGSKAINPELLALRGQDLLRVKFVGKFIQSKQHLIPSEFLNILELGKGFVLFVEKKSDITRDEFDQELLSNISLYEEFLQLHLNVRSAKIFRQLYEFINPFSKVDFSHFQSPPPIRMNHWQVNRFLSEKEKDGASSDTIIHYECSIRPFFHWLITTHRQFENTHIDDFSVSDLTTEHVSEYERYLLKRVKRNDLSRKTASDAIYEIAAFLRYLYQKGYILNDVAAGLKPIKQGDTYHYRDIPTADQLQFFFRTIDVYSNEPLRDKLAYGLMLHVGLRLREVATLKWDSINLNTSTVSLLRKGSKPSKMYLPKVLMGYIRKIKKKDGEVYIFGKTGAYERIYQNYKVYAALAKWDFEGGCHLFRHTFLTHLSYFSDPKLLMRLGDLNRLETVSKYVHRREQEKKQAINKLKMKE